MKLFILTFFVLSISFSSPSLKAMSLLEAYEFLKKNSQTLNIQEEKIKQAKEHYTQARAPLLPKLSFQSSYTKLEDPHVRGVGPSQLNQRQTKLALTQGLFHGFKEFYQMDAAREEEKSMTYTYSQLELSQFSSLAKLYIQILSIQTDLETLKEMELYTQKRVEEIKRRVSVGRSRESELLNAKSQVLSIEAQKEAVLQNLRLAQNQFIQITSLPSEALFPLSITAKDAPFFKILKLDSYENYWGKAQSMRADLKASVAGSNQALSTLSVTKTLHYPSLDFSANYYLDRNGANERSKWDVGIVLSIPLFEGLSSSSLIEESSSKLREKKLAEINLMNNIEADVRNAYAALEQTSRQLSLLEEAFIVSEKSYKAQERDAQNGLASMIDVLQFYNSCLDIKRNRDKVRYQIYISQIDLSVATGKVEGI